MPFVAKCDFCGKAHRCRDTTHGKSIDCKQCENLFVAMDTQLQEAAYMEAPHQLPPRRKRRKKPKQPSESFETDESASPEKQSRWNLKNLTLIFGGCAAICGVIVYSQAAIVPDLARKVLTLCTMACLFVAHQQFCRYRIHAEISSFGGQVDSIHWRPFQGVLFSRGWHVQRIYTFFTVQYRERDGRKKEEMCGVSWIFGTRWDWD